MFVEMKVVRVINVGCMAKQDRENMEEKNLTFDCFVFFCMSLYTSLYGAMTAPMSLLQPHTQGPTHL